MKINHHMGFTLDAGSEGESKQIQPSLYPLFNFHTDDIQKSFEFVHQLEYKLETEIVRFDDVAFFTISDPDRNMVMICTG
jgi:hypothetical protein